MSLAKQRDRINMAIYHKRKENVTSMQPIPNMETKERLQKQIMDLMTERMKAREARYFINQEKTRLRVKMLENARLNQQLDFRIDKLMEQFTK